MDRFKHIVASILLFSGALCAQAFSLMGPYAPWMQPIIGYQREGDIGGPMDIDEEYRWNVPVITYGFDEAFLTLLGERGVNAVESAIAEFNDLPPASEMDLANYYPYTLAQNPMAGAYDLMDLKSVTLRLLLEQLGLASPERSVYTLSGIERTATETNCTIIERNFHPNTLRSTNIINDVLYFHDGYLHLKNPERFVPNIVQISLEPNAGTVAGQRIQTGHYFVSFTQDDIGGLRYLYNPTNRNVESLLPGVTGIGTNASNFVATALRPGVDKITFARQAFDHVTRQFVPFTNDFTDRFFLDDEAREQSVRRVCTRPDIVFSAADFGVQVYSGVISGGGSWNGRKHRNYYLKTWERTGTSNWANHAALNGGAHGPGVITPGITITFQDMWKYYIAAGNRLDTDIDDSRPEIVNASSRFLLGSFADTANVLIHRSEQTNLSHLTLESRITETNSFYWAILANRDAVYDIKRSADLQQWEIVQTFTNTLGLHVFLETNMVPHGFYRAEKVQ